MHEAAARLPRIAIRRPPQAIGKETVAAMQSGIFFGYVSLIDGLVTRMKAEYLSEHGGSMLVIGTGGVASLFEGASEAIDRFDPDLTLTGLLEIHRRNPQTQREHDSHFRTTDTQRPPMNSSSSPWEGRTRSA